MQTCPEIVIVPASIVKSAEALSDLFTGSSVKVGADGKSGHGLKIVKYQSPEGVDCNPEIDAARGSSVQRKDAATEGKCFENILVVSSSMSQKSGSASLHADIVMGRCSTRTSKNGPPMVLKSSTSTSILRGGSTSRGIQKIGIDSPSDQRRVFSARDRLFALIILVHLYRPRYSGGNKIKSVMPGTKQEPQWCPTGHTHSKTSATTTASFGDQRRDSREKMR
jgi:hypothetical protein